MTEIVTSYNWRGHGPLWNVYWLYGVLGSNARCAFNVEEPMYAHMARALTAAWAINALVVLGFLELQFLQAVS